MSSQRLSKRQNNIFAEPFEDNKKLQWKEYGKLYKSNCYSSVTMINNDRFVICGGFRDRQYLQDCVLYDFK